MNLISILVLGRNLRAYFPPVQVFEGGSEEKTEVRERCEKNIQSKTTSTVPLVEHPFTLHKIS